MSDSNRYSTSQMWCVAITLHPLYSCELLNLCYNIRTSLYVFSVPNQNSLINNCLFWMVGIEGLEPSRAQGSADFKSDSSTSSDISPYDAVFRSRNSAHLSLKSSNRLVESWTLLFSPDVLFMILFPRSWPLGWRLLYIPNTRYHVPCGVNLGKIVGLPSCRFLLPWLSFY